MSKVTVCDRCGTRIFAAKNTRVEGVWSPPKTTGGLALERDLDLCCDCAAAAIDHLLAELIKYTGESSGELMEGVCKLDLGGSQSDSTDNF